ncbi:UbiA family prenyltransferase [Nocardioides sp.]|uniref:UbiA family prenyltransferase n=1 Tax=Nocardioides sp. TaxID=35761 RepID=UPI00321B022A
MARVHLPKRRRPGPDTPDTPKNPGTTDSPQSEGSAVSTLTQGDPPRAASPGEDVDEADRQPWRRRLWDSTPVTLLVAAHPRQGAVTALAIAAAALVAGRPAREAGTVLLTVLVGQAILGWHNDLVDRERDSRHRTPHKPIADGRLEAGTAWYALVVALLLVIPLSISTGVTAGVLYLASLVVGILGNVVLRRGRLSPLPWAASFALYPCYLSYGGFGGSAEGDPPQVAMVVAAALLGVGVHFLRAIWGLVEDDQDGWTYLPLVLGRRLGATRLLVVSATFTGVVVAVLVVIGSTVGLRQ